MIYSVIILLVVIGAFVLNTLYKHTNHYNNQFLDVKRILDSIKNGEKYQIVNVGSNHPKFAFDYSVEPDIKGANWAIGPQTFEYDFAVLRKFRPYLAENAIVVLPICLKKFFLYRQYNRAIHAKYYTFLPKVDIVGYTIFEKWRLIDYPLFFNPRLLLKIIKDVDKDNRLLIEANPMSTAKQLTDDSNYWISNWDREFGVSSTSFEISEKNKKDIDKNIAVLRNMIDYCISEGLRPVLCLLPVTHAMIDNFSVSYLNEYLYKYIYISNNKKIPFLNYLNDEDLLKNDLYINSFFFNKKGRQLFTQIFIRDIASIGLL